MVLLLISGDWISALTLFSLGFLALIITSLFKHKESFKSVTSTVNNSKGEKSESFSLISREDIDNNFERFSWLDMENLVGKLFVKKGYSVTVTPPRGDFGIDVTAKNDSEYIGIQVKHWKNDVGFEDCAKTLGVSHQYNKAIIISTKSGFTSQAWKFQNDNQYRLEFWDSTRLKKEFRENFDLSNSSTKGSMPKGWKPVTFVQDDKIDSFDYDQGFNLDEVYDSKESEEESGIICANCGRRSTGKICKYCERELV